MNVKSLNFITLSFLSGLLLISNAQAGFTHTAGGLINAATEGVIADTGSWTVYKTTDSSTSVSGTMGAITSGYWAGELGQSLGALTIGNQLMARLERETHTGTITHSGYYAVTSTLIDGNDPTEFPVTQLRTIPTPSVNLLPDYNVQLTWDDVAASDPTHIAGYRVYRSSDGIHFDEVTTTTTMTTASYSDSNFPVTTAYYAVGLVYQGIPELISTLLSANSASMRDNDGDAIQDDVDLDDDNDGLPDIWETDNFLNPLDASDALLDTDTDGASNLEEYHSGTDPQNDQSIPVNTAADTENLVWSMNGDAPWVAQNTLYHVGLNALQSGIINDGQSSSIETSLSGPTAVSFYWKVSSQSGADFLAFTVDDIEMDSIDGEVDWQLKTFNLGPGSHTLRWTYSKDGSTTEGSDVGWLDGVTTKPMVITPMLFLLL